MVVTPWPRWYSPRPMHARPIIATFAVAGMLLVAARAVAQEGRPDDGPATDAFASFDDALRFAENSFVYGDYADVVRALEPRLLPRARDGADVRALVRAYTLLGTAAHFETAGPDGDAMAAIADAAFLELLLLDPRFRLDPLLYPPRVIERFESVREANRDRLDALIDDADVSAVVYYERDVREQSRLVSMLPFGYGFFASDRDVAGMSYAIAESALGGTMIGLFLANEVARGDDGFFDDPERARNRGTAQIATASAFTALIVANALHGALTHDRSRRVEYRTLTEPPPELLREPGDSRSRGWSFSFAPIIGPR